MQGFSKYLNTRQDVENMIDRYPQETAAYLQKLLDGRFAWMVIGELAADDDGLVDDTHKVVEEEREGRVVRLQMELREDPGAHLFRLGLTVEEAEKIITTLTKAEVG